MFPMAIVYTAARCSLTLSWLWHSVSFELLNKIEAKHIFMKNKHEIQWQRSRCSFSWRIGPKFSRKQVVGLGGWGETAGNLQWGNMCWCMVVGCMGRGRMPSHTWLHTIEISLPYTASLAARQGNSALMHCIDKYQNCTQWIRLNTWEIRAKRIYR